MIKIIPLSPSFFLFFFSFFYHIVPLSHSHSLSSQLRSLKLTLFTIASPTHHQRRRHRSSTSPTHQSSQAADQPQTHAAIRLKPLLSIGVLACGYWVLDWETHGARWPIPSVDLARWCCACLWLVIFYFFLWLVVLFGLGWEKRLEIWDFFFFPCCGLRVLVLVVIVGVTDGRGCCDWYCECFLSSEIYYFIIVVILFYCDVYIILFCWKLK